MQALIDFDGWRKWRGFQDSPRSSSPGFDSAASPMQIGSHTDSPPPPPIEPESPSVARTASKSKEVRVKRPHLHSAAEAMRENSWASERGSETPASSLDPAQGISPSG